MNSNDIASLIASRLEDLADQVEFLMSRGFVDEAMLLREEGLALAEAYDNEEDFFFVQDYTTI
jgi:hypothetical protein